ncbi:unnamed protein product [Camellia sinensis]
MEHQHIVRYYQAWIEEGYIDEKSQSDQDLPSSDDSDKPTATLYIQMEFCPSILQARLDLSKELDNQIDQDTIWCYFRQIVEGVEHIHHQGVIHRDLTRANIFSGQKQ